MQVKTEEIKQLIEAYSVARISKATYRHERSLIVDGLFDLPVRWQEDDTETNDSPPVWKDNTRV